jgi:hypothetical protein
VWCKELVGHIIKQVPIIKAFSNRMETEPGSERSYSFSYLGNLQREYSVTV